MEVRPIDYVVPMVFHDDVLWQEDFKKVNSRFDVNSIHDFVRFRSWSLEELLIRCVKRNMPFVRTIYIVLARESQKKDWMDQEGVRVVYHREFIPERFLPTFNSCAIEMFLDKIPGISDRFIYGNDDMFPLTELSERDFFEGDVPCQHCGFKPMPDNPNAFHKLCLAGLNFVASEFGLRYTDVILKCGHGLTPLTKNTCEWLWHRGRKEIEDSISPFRTAKNFSQWIFPWWHHLSGNYIDRPCPTSYVSTRSSVDDVVSAIGKAKGVVCVNDNECESDYMKYAVAVSEAIKEKLL